MAYIHGNISAGTTKATAGEIVFSNSNGISFGINGQTVTGTVQTNYLTTAMLSNAATISNINVSGGTTSSNLSNFKLIDSNGVSWSLDTGSKIYATVKTDYLTTAMLSNAATISNINVSGGTTSSNLSNFKLIDSNGVSWSLDTGSKIYATVKTDYLTTADLSQNSSKYVQAWELTGNTAGTTSSLQGTKMYFEGGNSITVSGNSNTVKFSVGNYITTAMLSNAATISNINVSGGTTSSNLSAIKFIDSQGVSWSLDTGSKVYATVKTAYAGTGTTFAGANISGSMTNDTAGLNLSLSVAAPGAAAENNWFNISGDNTAGNTTASGSTIGISVQGALTISGTNNSQIKISAPATSSIVGTNGITISTNGSTISVQPVYRSSYQNLPGLINSSALTFNQTSISQAVAFMLPFPISASFLRIPALMTTNSTTIATMASATATASGALYSTLNAVIYSLGIGGNSRSLQSVASGSAGWTMQQSISITNSTQGSYTLAISGQANGAGTTRTTQYSISNTNYSFTTNQIATEFSTGRFLDVPFATSLSPGQYWLVIGMSTSTASAGAAGLAALTNCNVRYSNHYGASQANVGFGVFGSTNMSSGGQLGNGFFSTAGGGTTNSLPISAISSTASNPIPYFQLLRSA